MSERPESLFGVMTPADLAGWRAACFPLFDGIATDIAQRVLRGELESFAGIEQAIGEGIHGSRLVESEWLGTVLRSLPSRFAYNDRALRRVAEHLGRGTYPEAVRRAVENHVPTRYRSPTPMIVRYARWPQQTLVDAIAAARPATEPVDARSRADELTELVDRTRNWKSADRAALVQLVDEVSEMDYDDHVTQLVDDITRRATAGELTTERAVAVAVHSALTHSPLLQREWVAAYLQELPGDWPPSEGAVLMTLMSLRSAMVKDLPSRVAARLPALYHGPKPRPGQKP